jgi:hypothetical protein
MEMEINFDERDILEYLAKNLRDMIIENMREFDVYSKELLKAFDVRVEDGGIVIEIDEPLVFVEFGTRSHVPPLEPLVKWAKRKFRVKDNEAFAIAKAVQKKISEKGTEPKPVIRTAIYRFIDELSGD